MVTDSTGYFPAALSAESITGMTEEEKEEEGGGGCSL